MRFYYGEPDDDDARGVDVCATCHATTEGVYDEGFASGGFFCWACYRAELEATLPEMQADAFSDALEDLPF